MTARSIALASLVAVTLAAPVVRAREVGGVNLPDTATIAGKTLHLNGVGIRKKFIIKVYVGGLYLEAPAKSAAAITGSDQTRRITMQFLRDVDRQKIVGAWREGFEKNSKAQMAELSPALDKVAAAMTDMKSGGVMTVDYAPGVGTTVAIAGGPSVTIPGKTFGDAILRNWLGEEPADKGLKEAMLAGS